MAEYTREEVLQSYNDIINSFESTTPDAEYTITSTPNGLDVLGFIVDRLPIALNMCDLWTGTETFVVSTDRKEQMELFKTQLQNALFIYDIDYDEYSVDGFLQYGFYQAESGSHILGFALRFIPNDALLGQTIKTIGGQCADPNFRQDRYSNYRFPNFAYNTEIDETTGIAFSSPSNKPIIYLTGYLKDNTVASWTCIDSSNTHLDQFGTYNNRNYFYNSWTPVNFEYNSIKIDPLYNTSIYNKNEPNADNAYYWECFNSLGDYHTDSFPYALRTLFAGCKVQGESYGRGSAGFIEVPTIYVGFNSAWFASEPEPITGDPNNPYDPENPSIHSGIYPPVCRWGNGDHDDSTDAIDSINDYDYDEWTYTDGSGTHVVPDFDVVDNGDGTGTYTAPDGTQIPVTKTPKHYTGDKPRTNYLVGAGLLGLWLLSVDDLKDYLKGMYATAVSNQDISPVPALPTPPSSTDIVDWLAFIGNSLLAQVTFSSSLISYGIKEIFMPLFIGLQNGISGRTKLWKNTIYVGTYPFESKDIVYGSRKPIYVGGTDVVVGTQQLRFHNIEDQWVQIDCGSIPINEYWGNFIDYNPYTSMTIYLPYCGTFDIDVNDVMNGVLYLKYIVNLANGNCLATVRIVRDANSNGSVGVDAIMYQFSGNMLNTFALDKEQAIQEAQRADQAMQSATVAVASAGAGLAFGSSINSIKPLEGTPDLNIPAIGGSTYSNAELRKRHNDYDDKKSLRLGVSPKESAFTGGATLAMTKIADGAQARGTSYNYSSVCDGIMQVQRPYVIIHRPIQCVSELHKSMIGFPSNVSVRLSDVEGYYEVAVLPRLNFPTATEPELTMLIKQLEAGVFNE